MVRLMAGDSSNPVTYLSRPIVKAPLMARMALIPYCYQAATLAIRSAQSTFHRYSGRTTAENSFRDLPNRLGLRTVAIRKSCCRSTVASRLANPMDSVECHSNRRIARYSV